MLKDVREAAVSVQEAWGEVVKALRPTTDPIEVAKALKLAGLRVTQLGLKLEDYIIMRSKLDHSMKAQQQRIKLDSKTEL